MKPSDWTQRVQDAAEKYAIEERGWDFHFGEVPLAKEQEQAYKAGANFAREEIEAIKGALEMMAETSESHFQKLQKAEKLNLLVDVFGDDVTERIEIGLFKHGLLPELKDTAPRGQVLVALLHHCENRDEWQAMYKLEINSLQTQADALAEALAEALELVSELVPYSPLLTARSVRDTAIETLAAYAKFKELGE